MPITKLLILSRSPGASQTKFLINFFYFSEFRTGKAPIMVATDVAARGLGKSHSDFG